MSKTINDGLSRQRRWQLKKQAEGKCVQCGSSDLVTGTNCAKCAKGMERNGRLVEGMCRKRGCNEDAVTKYHCAVHAREQVERVRRVQGYGVRKYNSKYNRKGESQ